MANTVNDVMNVIASPDYGIKSIAGTTHEILAILQGTHNSQNNIHNIVDDVRNLLQEIVTTSTSKKPVEIGNNNNSTKINNKHIQNILDETKGIRKALINLEKSIIQQGKGTNVGVAKLSDKASEKVAEAMVKNIEKQKKGGGMSAIVDAFTKLKDISLKDIILGNIKLKKISEIFKDVKKKLKIKDKDLNSIIKLINATPQMIKSLLKVSLMINIIIKNNTIKKLEDILVGKKNSIISISKLLRKNKKDITEGAKMAKKITTLIGNLLIASIFLTIAAVTGLFAILGAKLLKKMVDSIIPITKKLSKHKKDISKSIGSALLLTAFTGLMALSSLFLASIAVTGLPAILGSVLMMGIITINIFAFKLLSKAFKNILLGSIAMTVMSVSLIVFSIALKKISDATKGVSWEQFGMIAAFTGLFAAAIGAIGIMPITAAILLGSVALMVMSMSLMVYSEALKNISKATEKLESKHISLVADSMWDLGWGISKISVLLPIIPLGAMVVRLMGSALLPFVSTLKILSDIKTVPTKSIENVLEALKIVGNFFKENGLNIKTIWNAQEYSNILPPFTSCVFSLSMLNKMGSRIPLNLVQQSLFAMSLITYFYNGQNMGFWGAIGNRSVASSIIGIVESFSETVAILSELKKMGRIPISLVHGALNAISLITNYYNNQDFGFWGSISNSASASSIAGIVESFGETVAILGELKKLGRIPVSLVHGALNAISLITDYYNNQDFGFWGSISNSASASSIAGIVESFSEAVAALGELKKLGRIPVSLVHGALNAISLITDYYNNQDMGFWGAIENRASASSIAGIVESFSEAVAALGELKKLGRIPVSLVHGALNAISLITDYYNNQDIGFWDTISSRASASSIAGIVKSFSEAVGTFKDMTGIKNIPTNAIDNILNSISGIVWYYRIAKIDDDIEEKSNLTEYAVNAFTNMAMNIQHKLRQIVSVKDNSVIPIILTCKHILNFLKRDSLNVFQITKANKNISLLNRMTSVMLRMSKINPMDLSSIGYALSDVLNGVNTIDMNQIVAVTNMFNAFNKINKSENIINKFAESVKEFTTACNNLMDAMSNNTNAINNIDIGSHESDNSNSVLGTIKEKLFDFIGLDSDNNDNTTKSNGIRITNVDEVAKAIAEKINGTLSVDVPDSQVQLLINGTGGNEWTITRY